MALEVMLQGESVFLTGPAGSGKTYVLNEFIKLAKKHGKVLAVTATTGLAATHLSGTTIHAWSGIGVHSKLPGNFYDTMTKGRIEAIQTADVLIIDEISMLHDYRLDLVNSIAKTVRQSDEPFGGLQVILCGDFFQLPPVNRADDEVNGGFVVSSQAWSELDPTVCYLQEQHRQDDDDFLEILNALRAGDIRRHHAEKLMNRLNAEVGGDQEVTELHTTNVDVDGINKSKLAAIEDDAFVYSMQTTGSDNYVESLKRSCLAAEDLILKKGALVMCIKNSPDRKYANGSLGIVVGFEEDTNYPIVKLRNGREVIMQPDTWELRDGKKKRAGLTQIPLRLAWAITVHKSQGMTLDAARINLRRAFVEGMGYVALSRVKSLSTLCLTGINNMALRVSRDALEIDELLRARAVQDQKKFSHLQEMAAVRQAEASKPKSAKKPKNTEWANKIEEMRKTYPKAFKPWAKAEDALLISAYKDGKNINEMCSIMQRQPGGVIARLKKHFGEDAAIKS